MMPGAFQGQQQDPILKLIQLLMGSAFFGNNAVNPMGATSGLTPGGFGSGVGYGSGGGFGIGGTGVTSSGYGAGPSGGPSVSGGGGAQ